MSEGHSGCSQKEWPDPGGPGWPNDQVRTPWYDELSNSNCLSESPSMTGAAFCSEVHIRFWDAPPDNWEGLCYMVEMWGTTHFQVSPESLFV